MVILLSDHDYMQAQADQVEIVYIWNCLEKVSLQPFLGIFALRNLKKHFSRFHRRGLNMRNMKGFEIVVIELRLSY